MNALLDNAVTLALPSGVDTVAQERSASDFGARPRQASQATLRSGAGRSHSEKWSRLMVAAQRGESKAYEQLLRELDRWLRCYYARRLPRTAAEDARQDVLLAIHAKRHAYTPSKPFGPWVAAIARNKWIDHLRDATRYSALSLHDEIPIEDREEPALSAVAVSKLLRLLKPAQARVIRLVKLQGFSIDGASDAT